MTPRMKFEVGDRATVRSDLKVGEVYGSVAFVERMKSFVGQTLIITRVSEDEGYHADDGLEYIIWSEDMFDNERGSAEMKFEIGDKVKVKKDIGTGPTYSVYCSEQMCELTGTETEITGVLPSGLYEISADDGGWNWSQDMLELPTGSTEGSESDEDGETLQTAVAFLKELQAELQTQEIDSQASPRFWTVGDYQWVPTDPAYCDDYHIHVPEEEFDGSVERFVSRMDADTLSELSDKAREIFAEIKESGSKLDEDDVLEWVKAYLDEDAELIAVREEHIVRSNTFFLTKKEAQAHIDGNRHHYTSKVHTYAMSALRAPTVSRLWGLLESFDWNQLEKKGMN